jgi:hypothetical protein
VPYQFTRRYTSEFAVEGRPPAPPEKPLMAQLDSVSEEYFSTMRIPLLRGRAFSSSDGETAPPVAIVTEGFQKRFFPGEDPVGKRIGLGNTLITIVGVAADIRDSPFDRDIWPLIYRPLQQASARDLVYALRTARPLEFVPAVRAALAEMLPGQPISGEMTMEKMISNRMTELRFMQRLMLALGGLALLPRPSACTA